MPVKHRSIILIIQTFKIMLNDHNMMECFITKQYTQNRINKLTKNINEMYSTKNQATTPLKTNHFSPFNIDYFIEGINNWRFFLFAVLLYSMYTNIEEELQR